MFLFIYFTIYLKKVIHFETLNYFNSDDLEVL